MRATSLSRPGVSLLSRPGVSLHRAADRHQTRIGWLHGRHSFDTGIDPNGRPSGNPDAEQPLDLIQMWVVPDDTGVDPGYEQLELNPWEVQGRLAVVASGMPRHDGQAAIRIRNRSAAFHVARLESGETVAVPDAPFAHVYLARGLLDLEAEGLLEAGDAARLAAAGERRLTAVEPSEVLIWEMHPALT
jgi:redox-sensitive bicupin YhaK (pirin superfamily)